MRQLDNYKATLIFCSFELSAHSSSLGRFFSSEPWRFFSKGFLYYSLPTGNKDDNNSENDNNNAYQIYLLLFFKKKRLLNNLVEKRVLGLNTCNLALINSFESSTSFLK